MPLKEEVSLLLYIGPIHLQHLGERPINASLETETAHASWRLPAWISLMLIEFRSSPVAVLGGLNGTLICNEWNLLFLWASKRFGLLIHHGCRWRSYWPLGRNEPLFRQICLPWGAIGTGNECIRVRIRWQNFYGKWEDIRNFNNRMLFLILK